MSESLMTRTRRLLHESEETLPDIHVQLSKRGSEITFYWLRKFSSGEIKDPSVNRVEELYEYLTGQPIFVESK